MHRLVRNHGTGRVFSAYFPYFEKIKVGLWDHDAVCVSVNPSINFWIPEPIFMKLCIYILTLELIWTAYFINPSHQSVCLYRICTPLSRQRLGKNVTAATNTHETGGELLDASFSMRSVSYQRKVRDYYFPELLVSKFCIKDFGIFFQSNIWFQKQLFEIRGSLKVHI
jgi:hypothetical protein